MVLSIRPPCQEQPQDGGCIGDGHSDDGCKSLVHRALVGYHDGSSVDAAFEEGANPAVEGRAPVAHDLPYAASSLWFLRYGFYRAGAFIL